MWRSICIMYTVEGQKFLTWKSWISYMKIDFGDKQCTVGLYQFTVSVTKKAEHFANIIENKLFVNVLISDHLTIALTQKFVENVTKFPSTNRIVLHRCSSTNDTPECVAGFFLKCTDDNSTNMFFLHRTL